MELATHRHVEVRLPGSRKRPDADAVSVLKELPKRFAALRVEIERHLYEHYAPYREAVEAGEENAPRGASLPVIDAPSDVWQSTRPVRIIVESTHPRRMEIAFQVAWDEEHTVERRSRSGRSSISREASRPESTTSGLSGRLDAVG